MLGENGYPETPDWLPESRDVEALCVIFHDAYEAAAIEAGWATQERSRKPWADVPDENKATMRATIRAVLASDWFTARRMKAHAECPAHVSQPLTWGGDDA